MPIVCSALGGIFLGKWLERDEKERHFKKSLFQVNKYLMVWVDLALAKLSHKVVSKEEYLQEVNDCALEAKAMLEVIGSVELNFASNGLKKSVLDMTNVIQKYKDEGKFNPDIEFHISFQE